MYGDNRLEWCPMRTYTITKNGFAIGQARGKHNAIKLMTSDIGKKQFTIDTYSNISEWYAKVDIDNDRYTIQESKGDI